MSFNPNLKRKQYVAILNDSGSIIDDPIEHYHKFGDGFVYYELGNEVVVELKATVIKKPTYRGPVLASK